MAQSLSASKISISLSYLLSLVGVVFFFVVTYRSPKHFQTPFSSILIINLLYWALTLLFQFLFIFKIFFNTNVSEQNQSNVIAVVGPHFTVSNILNGFWCYFFAKQKFILAEIILIVNLLNLLTLYFTHKTIAIKNLSDWLTVHLPVTSLPLSWTLYAIFWNGACLFHSHNKSLLPRLLANILIWEFFLVPNSLLLLYSDWSIGLATSFLMLGVGFSQMFTKLIALQWIFAFIISGLDFTLSILTMFGAAVSEVQVTDSTNSEQAPLLA